MTLKEIITEEWNKQRTFIKLLLSKYGAKEIIINIYPSKHFTERLNVDRKDEISITLFNMLITKLIKRNLGQLLYLMEVHNSPGDSIAIKYNGVTVIGAVQEGGQGEFHLMLRTIHLGEPTSVEGVLEL